jgi:hypothetical protein
MSEEPDLELDIRSAGSLSEALAPEYIERLRDLIARLRASDRSAMIFVDGKRGTIQVWNTVPAGLMKIR